MKTYNELIEIAKQKKFKHKRYKKHELEKIFELGEKDPTVFYEKYCKEKSKVRPVLAINSKGDELEFPSLYATAKYFHSWPATIKWRILAKKPLKLSNGFIWSFFYQKKQT